MESAKTIKVLFQTINGTASEISFSDHMTGYQLKEYIFKNVTKSLGALQMKLSYAGAKIHDDKLLSEYKFVQGPSIKIKQEKCDFNEIPNFSFTYEEDPIGGQLQTYRMPCGHIIGRDCMTNHLRALIQQNDYIITCPAKKLNGKKCEGVWDFALCRKVGVLTQQEVQEFQMGISKNWVKLFTLQCPKCQESLYKGGLNTKRVKCPACNYGDFCSLCCRLWIASNNNECGNKDCDGKNDLLKTCPWDRVFKLQDQKGVYLDVNTPRYRACTNCNFLISHEEKCKHMECSNCNKSFCWICLVSPENSKWKCGGPFDYCGIVAQAQKLPVPA